MTTIILILAVFWLAYSNGANDNFKGVATLYGSSTASYRKALMWATLATAAGSLVSVTAASKLLAVFSGKGLVPESLVGTRELLIAVGLASAITIFLATWLGLPTSTTHALTGGLLGVAVVTATGSAAWATMTQGFVAPLLLSPVVAIAVAGALYVPLRRVRLALGVTKQTCLCVGNPVPQLVQLRVDGSAALSPSSPHISVGQTDRCVERYQGQLVGVDAQTCVDAFTTRARGRSVSAAPSMIRPKWPPCCWRRKLGILRGCWDWWSSAWFSADS